MASAKEPLKYSATLKQTKLYCQIDWTIEDYLTWSELKEDHSEQFSPDFEFYFPEVNKTYVFALKIRPKGGGKTDDSKDLALYLMNQKPEPVDVKVDLRIGSKVSAFTHSYETVGGYGFCSLLTNDLLLANRNDYLPDGNLNIQCKFVIIHTSSVIVKDLEGVDEEKDDLCKSMEKLLDDDTLADFEIVSGSEVFPCHKSILANQSDVFATVMNSSSWEENKNNQYPIDGHDPKIVKQMIHFIYTNRLPDGVKCSPQLLLIADRFRLKGLIQFCKTKLSKSLTTTNAIQVLDAADKVPDAASLKIAAVQFIADNLPFLIGTDDWNNILGKSIKLLNSVLKIKF